METEPERNADQGGRWRPIALLSVIAAVLLLAHFLGIGERLSGLRTWIGSLGGWGPVVYLGIYIVAVVAALPGSALTIVAGALFGSLVGIVVVSIGSTLGASLSFLIARYFARDSAARWLSKNEKFSRLDGLTERHGAVIVALTRLVPLFPFNLLNYGFGLTRVPFWTYVFWSWLCMLPGTVLFVSGADALTSAIARGEIPWGLVALVAFTGLILAFLVVTAGRRLKEREADGGSR